MEDLATSLDKIVAKFNDSITHSAPKKLNLDYFNDSTETPSKRRRENSLSNSSLTPTTTDPVSPWETRRIKLDLLEAKTRIDALKHEMERQHKIHIETGILYEKKVAELKNQCEFATNKVQDTERRMVLLRKREQYHKEEARKANEKCERNLKSFDQQFEARYQLHSEAEQKSRIDMNYLANDIGMYRRHIAQQSMQLDALNEELDVNQNQLDNYKDRAVLADALQKKCEMKDQELESAMSRIKDLENEIASYNDWKEITTNSQARLLSMPELEKQLEHYKAKNKHLHYLLGNQLLMEEKMHNLQSRLEKETATRSELIALKVKATNMEQELKDWIEVAKDHCLPNMIVSPSALRSRIENILLNDICTSADKYSQFSETKSIQSELFDVKQKCEMFMKNVEELNVALKRHKSLKERLQRKLLLVSKERDFYKQLSENFEKDLTISSQAADVSSRESQQHFRIEMLEKMLCSYKEMYTNLETDFSAAKLQMSSSQLSIDNALNSDSYDYIKKELDALRMENDRLSRRKDELELELEQHCFRKDSDADKHKIVHFVENPASEAFSKTSQKVEKLQAEIERLKRQYKALEEASEKTQAAIIETSDITVNVMEINRLRSELDSTNTKFQKMKEYFKSSSMDFREVCYLLFGYRIDRVGLNTNYKLSSMYAESPDDYLNFRLNESNVLDMLETPYSATLRPLIESQLIANKSLPAFLAALTLDLYQRSTITIN